MSERSVFLPACMNQRKQKWCFRFFSFSRSLMTGRTAIAFIAGAISWFLLPAVVVRAETVGYSKEFFARQEMPGVNEDERAEEEDEPWAVVSGSYRLNIGIGKGDIIWKDANFLLQEKGWRWLFGEERHNTFDPMIYNQLKVSVDAQLTESTGVHTKIVVDPWSFLGAAQTITLPTWYGETDAGDPLEIRLKYWSNSSRTFPEIVRSARGGSFALPEIKVKDGYTEAVSVEGNWESGTPWVHRVDIPELKVNRVFMPLRALWLDIGGAEQRGTVFVCAEESIALYSDDPLRLINRHILWEPSPWLNKWSAGAGYTSGWEDGTWAREFQLRDSEGNWLTLLRGTRFSGTIAGWDGSFMLAAPWEPWDEYSEVSALPAALRLKTQVFDDWSIGGIYTGAAGFDRGSMDAFDQAVAVDAEAVFFDEHRLLLQKALSRSAHNLRTKERRRRADDYAYQAALESEIIPFDGEIKSRISYTCMGRDFEPPLASFAYTRDDQAWGRHLDFYPRSDEEEKYRIGDSIDKDRKVAGVDVHFGELEGASHYVNFRHVNRADGGEFLENISRYQALYKVNPRLRLKTLWVFNRRAKTTESVKQDTGTFGAGASFDLTPEITLEQITERTNDYPGFPGELYPWLTINPQPPYPYFNIFKSRLLYQPRDWLALALEQVYNEFKYAATLDDRMNYSGADLNLRVHERCLVRLVYRYSRVADYLRDGKVIGHHNVYSEADYALTKNSRLVVRFSELGNYIEGLGWQNSVLDTQHLVRIIYTGIF